MDQRQQSFRSIFSFLVGLILIICTFIPTQPVYAASLIVNTNADNTVAEGLCSLREAIVNANNNAATYSDCAAGSGADIISFVGNYTITLAGSQLPAITSTITINGNGMANTIIQANANNPVTNLPAVATHENRVFEVANGASLTLDGMTIRHGRCTGGCSSTITNGASGILNQGILTVTNSTLSGNLASTFGGGIDTTFNHTLIVTNSIFSGNSASFGGGIANSGNMSVTNGTFSGNTTSTSGGGIYTSSTGITTVENSIFSTNRGVTGGGIRNDGTVSITGSTLSGNSASNSGGGLFNTSNGIATVTNSIFSSNSSSAGGGIFNFNSLTVADSTFSDNGNNSAFGGGIYNSRLFRSNCDKQHLFW
ncbi:MAG: hypothetical protein QM730_08090 [Anaerolineales bacterium]